eukprot:3925721-Rhodomonas_salina.1
MPLSDTAKPDNELKDLWNETSITSMKKESVNKPQIPAAQHGGAESEEPERNDKDGGAANNTPTFNLKSVYSMRRLRNNTVGVMNLTVQYLSLLASHL